MDKNMIQTGGTSFPFFSARTIVVGSGAAGLNAAVSLVKEGQKDVLILTEGRRRGTSLNTGSDKQTYYKLTTCGSEPDSVRKMAQTLFDGQSMDGDLALVEAALSLRSFYHLVDIGVPFPHNGSGEYVGYKTDHDPNRRGSSAGPLTSKYMTEALWKEAEMYGIPVMDGYQVIDLLIEQGTTSRVRGLLVLNQIENQFAVFAADSIIYAVGGEAGMYDRSVYPSSQIGGMGAAFRAGAKGKNLTESQYGIASIKFRWNLSGTYQQVIPRYVSTNQEGGDKREFLDEYFPDCETLLYTIFLKGYQWPFDPRKTINYGSSLIDLLVYQETVIKGRRVYLDFRSNPSCSEKNGVFDFSCLNEETYDYLKQSDGLYQTPILRLKNMNPSAIELYKSHGIDLWTEMLEIAVCAQHNNGGLAGNCWWESNIKNLFPVGEVNGSHGVYRPGGSALNSGQCGSLRAAQYIAHRCVDAVWTAEQIVEHFSGQLNDSVRFGQRALSSDGPIFCWKEEHKTLGRRMTEYGANIRSKEGTEKALAENQEQMKHVECCRLADIGELKMYYRMRDLLLSQKIYLTAIADYISRGMGSRGSYLIYDAMGKKPLEALPEEFRFSLEEQDAAGQIQEISYHNGECTVNWRQVRPIPSEDCWFEKVWREYRKEQYYIDSDT